MNFRILDSEGRISWTMIAAGIGLLLIGVLTVINSVELARLAEQNPTDPLDAQSRYSPRTSSTSPGKSNKPGSCRAPCPSRATTLNAK